MKILFIDPGPKLSGFVVYDGEHLHDRGKYQNDSLIENPKKIDMLAIEQVRSYGMAVGAEVFDTVHWSGRFHQLYVWHGIRVDLVTRMDIKMHICKSPRAKDGNIRQALIDRFGQPGTAKNPSPFFREHRFGRMNNDQWQALAGAVTVFDKLGGLN